MSPTYRGAPPLRLAECRGDCRQTEASSRCTLLWMCCEWVRAPGTPKRTPWATRTNPIPIEGQQGLYLLAAGIRSQPPQAAGLIAALTDGTVVPTAVVTHAKILSGGGRTF